MKWWGWGDPSRNVELPQRVLDLLRSELGAGDRTARPVALEEVRVPDPRLSEKQLGPLRDAVGPEWVDEDRLARITHAAGKGYPDLVRLRAGSAESAPDAIVYPGGEEEVRSVLDACASAGIAVVPFGGGTSVVGGVEPLRDSFGGVISLDLGRMTRVSDVDDRSLTALLGPGLRGPQVESELGRHGLTLGHFPQSFEYATVGGWVATRSAGQASTGYGNIEKLVAGLRVITPTGGIDLPPMPATAAGPGLRQLLVGSEGVLGVITQAALKLRRKPAERHYEAWMFHDFEEGVEAFRALEQGDIAPDVARLSDESETRLSLALAGEGSRARRLGRRYMELRGYREGCVAILGFEGEQAQVRRRRALAERALKRGGGLSLGTSPGRAWERDRYAGPYLRDALLDHGVMPETLETAHQWSSLMSLYRAVREAIEAALATRGTPGLVMCHVSHLYPNGASLYFTFLARQQEGQELEQWHAVKAAATDAIVEAGGTITHHHAVGRDHAAWLPREVGAVGVDVIRSLKAKLDPAGILNPGKLVPGGTR